MEKVNAVCEHESMGKEEIVRSAVQIPASWRETDTER
jgi:hypothetical protein